MVNGTPLLTIYDCYPWRGIWDIGPACYWAIVERMKIHNRPRVAKRDIDRSGTGG